MADRNRRDFMRNSLLGLAALPLGAGILSKRAFAQDLPPLDPSAAQAKAQREQGKKDRKQIKRLERELHRKEKALAEAAALLVLQKKAQAIWGDGEDE